MLSLSLAFPVVQGILLICSGSILFKTQQTPNIYWKISLNLSQLGIGLVQITTGIFLLIAVHKIRQFLLKGISYEQINVKTMVLHSASFLFYMLSEIIYTVCFNLMIINSLRSQSIFKYYCISWILADVSSFSSQILLSIFFWQFRNKQSSA